MDPYMYKISEEDSQDEEVLNSLGGQGESNEVDKVKPVRVKPVPPAKPDFLKRLRQGLNANGELGRNEGSGSATSSRTRLQPIGESESRSSIPLEEEEEESSLDESGGQEESEDETTATVLRTHVSLLARRARGRERGSSGGSGSRSRSRSTSCSSCSGSGEGDYEGEEGESSYDSSSTGSLTEDNGFDSEVEIELGLREEVEALVTEADIQTWKCGDGSVLFCEYVSGLSGPETVGSFVQKTKYASGPDCQDLDAGALNDKGNKGKISQLLKKRKKGGNKSEADGTLQQESQPSNSKHKVFRFKDEQSGEIRKVSGPKRGMEDKRIMVAGFISDGAGARNKHIKIGDWLQKVNGILVDFSNVNSVLLQLMQEEQDFENAPLKVTLELQRVSGYTITEPKSVKFEDEVLEEREGRQREKLAASGKADFDLGPEILSNVALIYISDVNMADPSAPKERTKEVIFSWPEESESRKVKALVASHGMFSTMYKLLNDVTGSHPVLSRVMIDDEEMDVVFSSDDEGKGLMLLAMASVLSNFNICQSPSNWPSRGKRLRWKDPVCGGLSLAGRLMTRVEILLRFQFGSLSRAFRSEPEKLISFFSQVFAGMSDISEDFLFPQVPDFFLRVPLRIRRFIDERLYSFESSDAFTLVQGRLDEREVPLYHCLGSCLYYKGMTVVSHLERGLAALFQGWWRTQLGRWGLKRNALPYFWEPVRRLVLWQECWLDEVQVAEEGHEFKGTGPSRNQCVSVLVGVENLMLGLILLPIHGESRKREADIDWIQRGFNCVLQILKSDIHGSLETWILSQEKDFIELYPPPGDSSKPFLSGTTTKTAASTNLSSSSSSGNTTGSPNGILKNTEASASTSDLSKGGESQVEEALGKLDLRSPFQDYSFHYGVSSVHPAASAERLEMSLGPNNEEEEQDETTTGTGSDTSSMKWYFEETSRLMEVPMDEEELKTVCITKGNVLFDFLQIEEGRGVLLSSKENVEGPMSVVVHNFRQSATISHHILHKAVRGRNRLSRKMHDTKWVSKSLAPISEHGILFNCDVVDPRDVHKKKPRLIQLSYWVIGRMYSNQRELYVCYQDSSMSQNLVEIAFRLAYYSI